MGAGGAGPGDLCSVREDCPADSSCIEHACEGGVCVLTYGMPGQLVDDGSPNDCRKAVCGASGEVLTDSAADTEAPPDDGNECTDDVCQGGQPAHSAKLDGEPCSKGYCVSGECGPAPCLSPSDCGPVILCFERTCEANMCGVQPLAQGTVVADDSSMDCKIEVCDGSGATFDDADPDDIPSDGDPCTVDTCDGPVASHAPEVDGAACGEGMYCYNGACSECGIDANCPAADACHDAGICAAGTCMLVAAKADGTGCAANMYCHAGACSQCGVAANCPAAATCKVLQQCNGSCVYSNVANGTSCGFLKTCTNGVCS